MGNHKRELLELFARIGKAVASPARLELLDLLAQGEKPVERLAGQAGLSVTNASNHLKELRQAALVTTRREGSYVYYRLSDPAVYGFLRSLQELATRQLAEAERIIREFYRDPDALEPVAATELAERLRTGEVVVLDVRPEDEYAAAHIPGALSIPASELHRRLSEIPRDREVVAYCRGPYCVFALEAVKVLRSAGYRATRMETGLPDWRARGYAVAGSAATGEEER